MAIFKNEYESRKELKEYGMPMGSFSLAKSEDELKEMIKEIEFPLVMKIVSDQIIHKTEAGGVKLNINSEEEAVETFHELIANGKNYDPNAVIEGVFVSRMVPKGVEVIIGATRDKQFGPVVMFGLGGIFVEIFKDVEFRMAPLTQKEALKLIGSIQASKMLEGARGMDPVNKEALADFIVQLGNFMVENSDVVEIDLNPVICYADKVESLDASIGRE